MQDESGLRYKFDPVQRDSFIDGYPKLKELSAWCEAFDLEGLTPEEGGASAGNLSFRTTRGFVITPTRSQLKSGLGEQQFLEVVRVEFLDAVRFRVHYLGGQQDPVQGGRVPSSDVPMHHLIYCVRPDVAAVFHGHDQVVLAAADRLDVPTTPSETVFGTLRDARATVRALDQHDYIVRRGHGFVSVGRTMEAAGRQALEIHRRAKGL